MPAPPLVTQTTYAELLERCSTAAFAEAFPQDGTFVSKTVGGHRYWYFQASSGGDRKQKYVGSETAELLARIALHRQARDDERERRALVSVLVRSFGLPRPIHEIGEILSALAKAGVFRLRGVLVGTVAYHAYPALLSAKLPIAALQTGDIDIAQFKTVSVAIADQTPPVLKVLQDVDKTFRPVPHLSDGRRAVSYIAKGGLRVDFLTPNEGADTDEPQALPALQTDAQPLRFLDYLIYDAVPAVILHKAGVYVHVPAPERYAVHKLIVSRRRAQGIAKQGKDIQQAQALLEALAHRRPHELKLAWQEAYDRGPTWRQLLGEAVGQLAPNSRDLLIKVIDARRAMVAGIDLTFNNPPARYEGERDIVMFDGEAFGKPVTCAIGGEALDDHFGAGGLGANVRLRTFLENRSMIERMARTKFLYWPIEDINTIIIKTTDVPRLRDVSTEASARSAFTRVKP